MISDDVAKRLGVLDAGVVNFKKRVDSIAKSVSKGGPGSGPHPSAAGARTATDASQKANKLTDKVDRMAATGRPGGATYTPSEKIRAHNAAADAHLAAAKAHNEVSPNSRIVSFHNNQASDHQAQAEKLLGQR